MSLYLRKKGLLLTIVLFAFVLNIVGCTPEEESLIHQGLEESQNLQEELDKEYKVTINVKPQEAGEIKGSGLYKEGEKVNLEAKESEAYLFKSWEKNGEVVSKEKNYQFEVTEDTSLVANFQRKTYEVTIVKDLGELNKLKSVEYMGIPSIPNLLITSIKSNHIIASPPVAPGTVHMILDLSKWDDSSNKSLQELYEIEKRQNEGRNIIDRIEIPLEDKITSIQTPQISPDGKKIAYFSKYESYSPQGEPKYTVKIYISNFEVPQEIEHEIQLEDDELQGGLHQVYWAKKQDAIYYITTKGLMKYSLEEKEISQVFSKAKMPGLIEEASAALYDFNLQEEKEQLAYFDGDNIRILDIQTGEEELLDLGSQAVGQIEFLTDRYLLFGASRVSEEEKLFLVNLEDNKFTEIEGNGIFTNYVITEKEELGLLLNSNKKSEVHVYDCNLEKLQVIYFPDKMFGLFGIDGKWIITTVCDWYELNLDRPLQTGEQVISNIEDVKKAYRKANEAFTWFEGTTMPFGSSTKEIDGMLYYKVNHDVIKSYAGLENYLHSLFSKDIVEKLLNQEFMRYRDIEGELYTIPADRGSNIYKGKETLKVQRRSNVKFDCTLEVELLDENFAVSGYETHEFSYELNSGNWIFTNFYLFR